ncbi:unnamed protein product, partial [Scytosiphon promiscuus]
MSRDLIVKALELLFQQGADCSRSACSLKKLRFVNLGLCEATRCCCAGASRSAVSVGSLPAIFVQQSGRRVSNGAGFPAPGKGDESGGSRGSRSGCASTLKAPDALTNAGKTRAGHDASTDRP